LGLERVVKQTPAASTLRVHLSFRFQNWQISELADFRIGRFQNWQISELADFRIGRFQNWQISELADFRIGKSGKFV
jgi:hypothetical protein